MARDLLAEAEAELREYGLSLPEAYEEFPWGERALKVRKKVFVFMRRDDAHLGLSVKLTQSHGEASVLPFASPTGYGLGRAGWVTVRFEAGETPLTDLLRRWILESYRAIAPKRLSAQLENESG
jgi:predicted DNA-binding protein (MmcQ/YjbR family)